MAANGRVDPSVLAVGGGSQAGLFVLRFVILRFDFCIIAHGRQVPVGGEIIRIMSKVIVGAGKGTDLFSFEEKT